MLFSLHVWGYCDDFIKVGLATAVSKTALAMGIFHGVIPDQLVFSHLWGSFLIRGWMYEHWLLVHFSYHSSTSPCLFFFRKWRISWSLFGDIWISDGWTIITKPVHFLTHKSLITGSMKALQAGFSILVQSLLSA